MSAHRDYKDGAYYPPRDERETAAKVFKQFRRHDPVPVPQTAGYGKPIPVVYGTTRVAPNVIYVSGVRTQTLGFAVFRVRDWLVALSEGPIQAIWRVWRDKQVYLAPGNFLFPVDTLLGTRPTQTAWSMLTGDYALGYPGVACAGISIPEDASISSVSFEVAGLCSSGIWAGHQGDANPAEIVADMLTGAHWAVLDAGEVVTTTGRDGQATSSYRNYCVVEGFYLSPAFTTQQPLRDCLQEVLEATNSECLWTGGKLEIVPLGDEARTGGIPPTQYTPAMTVQYALTESDFLTRGDEPRIEIERRPNTDVRNIARVEFLDRNPNIADWSNGYNAAIVEVEDPADVAARGAHPGDVLRRHSVCVRDHAVKLAKLEAQQQARMLNRYTFRLGYRFCRLEPLDIVTLTDASLGLSAAPVRIVEIRESAAHELTIEAIDWPAATGSAVAHSTQSSDAPYIASGTDTPLQRLHRFVVENWADRPDNTLGVGSAIGWIGSKFVAAGNSVCATSVDGEVWTARTIPAGFYYSIAAKSGIVVATGAGVGASSPDGITWTSRTCSGRRVIWDEDSSQFLTTGGHVSSDGITWVWNGALPNSVPGNVSPTYYGMARGAGLLVAVGDPGALCYSSNNGTSWFGIEPPVNTDWSDVKWNGGQFIAVSFSGYVMTSLDGINWTSRGQPAGSGSFYDIHWSGSVWFWFGRPWVEGLGYSATVLTSIDGIHWRQRRLPTTYVKAAYDGRRWCGRRDNGTAFSLVI